VPRKPSNRTKPSGGETATERAARLSARIGGRYAIASAVAGAVVAAVLTAALTSGFGLLEGGSASRTPTVGQHASGKIADVQTPGISAAISSKKYRVLFAVTNNLSRAQQLSRISLVVSLDDPACAEVPEILYKIQNSLVVEKPTGNAQGAVSAGSGPLSGFEVPSTGKLNWGCGALDQLHLVFVPSGLVLPPSATTNVVIDIPRLLHVTYQYLPSKKPLRTTVELQGMDRTYQPYLAFRVTATASDGDALDSCFVLSVVPQIEQGPRNCNSKIDGNHVFWPFV